MSLALAGLGAAFLANLAYATGGQPNLYFPDAKYVNDTVSPRIDIDSSSRAFVDQYGR